MHRVLRSQGRLVITDWCDDYLACRLCDRFLRVFRKAHYRIYDSKEIRELLAEERFASIRVERYKINWLWGLMTVTGVKAVVPGPPALEGAHFREQGEAR